GVLRHVIVQATDCGDSSCRDRTWVAVGREYLLSNEGVCIVAGRGRQDIDGLLTVYSSLGESKRTNAHYRVITVGEVQKAQCGPCRLIEQSRPAHTSWERGSCLNGVCTDDPLVECSDITTDRRVRQDRVYRRVAVPVG